MMQLCVTMIIYDRDEHYLKNLYDFYFDNHEDFKNGLSRIRNIARKYRNEKRLFKIKHNENEWLEVQIKNIKIFFVLKMIKFIESYNK